MQFIPHVQTLWDNWQAISAIGTLFGAVGTVVGLIIRGLYKIRTNDLKHQDAKLDVIVTMLTSMKETDVRVEGKLDHHLEYHIEHKI